MDVGEHAVAFNGGQAAKGSSSLWFALSAFRPTYRGTRQPPADIKVPKKLVASLTLKQLQCYLLRVVWL